MILGDIHYAAAEYYPVPYPRKQKSINKYVQMGQFHSRDLLRAAGQCAAAEFPEFIVQLGDMTHGECSSRENHEKMFRDAFRLLKQYFPRFPVYAVKGNHDVRQRAEESPVPARNALLPLIASELGVRELRNGNYAFRKGKDLWMAIDCFSGDERCLDFIRKTFSSHPDTRYVFLLTHYPLLPAAVNRLLCLVPDSMAIAGLLEKCNAVILAAHTHSFSFVSRESAGGKLAQIVFTRMGNSWYNSHLIRKWFGNPLKINYTWRTYIERLKKRRSGRKDSAGFLEELSGIERSGKFSTAFFARKSGFVMPTVNDRRVEVRIYIDDSSQAAQTLIAAENR